MKKILLVLVILILISPVLAIGVGITPGCIGGKDGKTCNFLEIPQDQTKEVQVQVLNFGKSQNNFEVFVEGKLANFTKLTPTEFTLEPIPEEENLENYVCKPSNGCQIITAEIDTSDLEIGEYKSKIIALSKGDQGGALKANLQTNSHLNIEIVENTQENTEIEEPEKKSFGFELLLIIAIIIIFTMLYIILRHYKNLNR